VQEAIAGGMAGTISKASARQLTGLDGDSSGIRYLRRMIETAHRAFFERINARGEQEEQEGEGRTPSDYVRAAISSDVKVSICCTYCAASVQTLQFLRWEAHLDREVRSVIHGDGDGLEELRI
jgi:hypothetical protein